MAKHALIFLSITIFSLSYTVQGTNFVETWCQKTKNPAECIKILSPHGNDEGTNLVKLAEVAMSVAEKSCKKLGLDLEEEAKKPDLGPKESAAIKDCLMAMQDNVKLFSTSTNMLHNLEATDELGPDEFEMDQSKDQAYVSSILMNHMVCEHAFSNNDVEKTLNEAIKKKLSQTQRDTSIALQLINQLKS